MNKWIPVSNVPALVVDGGLQEDRAVLLFGEKYLILSIREGDGFGTWGCKCPDIPQFVGDNDAELVRYGEEKFAQWKREVEGEIEERERQQYEKLKAKFEGNSNG